MYETDDEELRFLTALTDEYDPLWWEVRINSNSRATYEQVARNLRDEGLIHVSPATNKFALTEAGERAIR